MFRNLLMSRKKVIDNKSVKKDLNDMLQASHLSNEEKFTNILNFAIDILDNNKTSNGKEHPIFDYIRLLGRGLQSDYMKYVFYYNCEGGDHGVPNLDPLTVWFDQTERLVNDDGNTISFYDLKNEIRSKKKINLSNDLILPWPWNRDRLFSTITKIGNGRHWGEWRQDYNNHYVEVWLPIGIAWVNGGNHSISIGVIQGAKLEPEYYYDISEVYKYVKCDGQNYFRTNTNNFIEDNIICPVKNVDFAAIFEIGRLLVERGISFIDN